MNLSSSPNKFVHSVLGINYGKLADRTQIPAMETSNMVEAADSPRTPEGTALSNSEGSHNLSSIDSDPKNGLEINCDIIEKFDQGIGPWLLEVLTCAFRDGEEEVASARAYLIKREEIAVRDNKKKSLRRAMMDEDRMLNVMFELPKIFHPHGHANPEFLLPLGRCFTADDMQAFQESNDAADHPINHAWILLIRDLVVDEEYRRLGIGGNMIRKTLQTVLNECVIADRPLLVAVQPKRIDEFLDEEWSQISEMIYHRRVNVVFWENIGFKRYKGSFGGFTAPWYFWGTAFSLPPKKKITIPDDLEHRNTRTATPPLRPRAPRNSNRATATPNEALPVSSYTGFRATVFRATVRPANRGLPVLLPAPPKNDSAPGNDAAQTGRWFDNPNDPSLAPEDAQHIRDLMRTLDALGKKYRVRPLREPVHPCSTQPMPRQGNCPFKATSGTIAPPPLWLSGNQPRKLPSPGSSQRAAAPEQAPRPAVHQSARDQQYSTQPGARFLVTSDEDDDPDDNDLDPDDFENCSYEELVAYGYLHGDEDEEYDYE